nr:hypothetical protein [Prevotella sp.]
MEQKQEDIKRLLNYVEKVAGKNLPGVGTIHFTSFQHSAFL